MFVRPILDFAALKRPSTMVELLLKVYGQTRRKLECGVV
jgi:hypothetical protein